MKLDKRYKQVRSNMLMMPNLPSVAQAYRILLQEETHLQLSTSGGSLNETITCRAYKRKYYEKGNNRSQYSEGNKNKKPTLWCEHCKMNGHIKEKCWKIVGYPANHKAKTWRRENNKNNTYANTTSTQEESEGYINAKFTKDQYQQILEMLNKDDPKTSTTHANTTQLTGTLCLTTYSMNVWIIDSGASDHMCHDIHQFVNYTSIENENQEVTIPDGTKQKIKCKGTVILHNGITQHDVLFVVKFKYNLISVSKLSSNIQCKIFFTLNECYIQETLMKKPWLLSEEKNGLYVIQNEKAKTKSNSGSRCTGMTTRNNNLLNKTKL